MEQGYEMPPYGVYVQADEQGRVVGINSDEFLQEVTGWIKIDEGYGDRYHHAQGNYLNGPVMNEEGVYRYKLEDGQVKERSQEEMAGDVVPWEPTPSITERVQTMERAMEALMGGIQDA